MKIYIKILKNLKKYVGKGTKVKSKITYYIFRAGAALLQGKNALFLDKINRAAKRVN